VRIRSLYARGKPVFSFEFFPPKTAEAAEALLATLRDLREMLAPDFVSVTYGAGGSTRERTVELVTRVQSELAITAMAHLTCVGHTRDELATIVDKLVAGGIENVLALRGDAPRDAGGDGRFVVTPGGFAHGSELAAFLKARHDVGVGGACYPECHPESPSADEDLRWLVHKVGAGVEFLITQLFFDNACYFRLVERARAAGVGVPIVPGIMPITNVAQIERFTAMCGATIPAELKQRLARYRDDPPSVMAIGIEHAIRQCRQLLDRGAPGVHFYTLNKSHATRSILAAIKAV
jgi:methylenetetrahydrofolate reductase (NADPH)